MKKWIFDSIIYTAVWMFGLGIVTVLIAPLNLYLIETTGGWVYLIYVILGALTKLYFVETKKYNEADKENRYASDYIEKSWKSVKKQSNVQE